MAEVLARDTPLPAGPAAYGDVTIAPAAPCARYSLRTRAPDGLPGILRGGTYREGTALGLGPDEWLLILPADAPAPVIAGPHALTDIRDRNLGIDIAGPGAAALIQTGCALDFARAFPPGKVTRTVYEGVEIVVWRIAEDRFRVEVWRSFAAYVWDALALAAGDRAAA